MSKVHPKALPFSLLKFALSTPQDKALRDRITIAMQNFDQFVKWLRDYKLDAGDAEYARRQMREAMAETIAAEAVVAQCRQREKLAVQNFRVHVLALLDEQTAKVGEEVLNLTGGYNLTPEADKPKEKA